MKIEKVGTQRRVAYLKSKIQFKECMSTHNGGMFDVLMAHDDTSCLPHRNTGL
jgi:hypothetical protein